MTLTTVSPLVWAIFALCVVTMIGAGVETIRRPHESRWMLAFLAILAVGGGVSLVFALA